MIDKEFEFLDARTSIRELIIEIIVNFFYGFIANTITVFVILRYDLAIFLNFVIYYLFVSIVINREKYESKFGKFMVFPVAAAIGAFTGYKLAFFLSNFL